MTKTTGSKGKGKGKGKKEGKEAKEAKGAAAAETKPKRTALVWRIARTSVMIALVLVLAGGLGIAGVFYVYSLDLPKILKREDFRPSQMTRIYSSEGYVVDELIAEEGRRTVVPFDAIAPTMKSSILAAEDADFYQHQGLDYFGMVRALYYALRYNRRQGASTITQQVVKNLILTPERTLKRKVQEIMLARELEQNLSKDDILYMYLNQIYFGHGNYGVQEASRYFFGKDARELTLAESATLAGIVQSPERYSPIRHPERTLARRKYVLEQLRAKGMIGEDEFNKAMRAELKVVKTRKELDPHLGDAPWYTAHVRRLLEQQFPEREVAAMGLKVHTALVIEDQLAADKAVRDGVAAFDARHGGPRRPKGKKAAPQADPELARRVRRDGLKPGLAYEAIVRAVEADHLQVEVGGVNGRLPVAPGSRANPERRPLAAVFQPGDRLDVMVERPFAADAPEVAFVQSTGVQAALVSIDVKTRRVEALVGGFDFGESSFNRATQARRQTGSCFKPIVYSAALADRVTTPATIWLDAPRPFQLPDGKAWDPRNADGKYLGPLRLRRALALSRNVIAVRLLEKVGIPRAQEYARLLGVESSLVDNYTMALGSSELTLLELTNVFTTLAALGVRDAPIFIVRIEDAWGFEVWRAQPDRQQTIPPEIAWLTVDVMKAVLTEGTAAKVGKQLKRPAAGKTGTTNNARDAWFVAFTPQKATGVWMGYDDNKPLGRGASGGTSAAPIWLDYMQIALKDLPRDDFEKPPLGIVEARIDKATGLLAQDGAKGALVEHFLTGTAPTDYAPEDGESTPGDFLLGQGGQDEGEAAAQAEAEE